MTPNPSDIAGLVERLDRADKFTLPERLADPTLARDAKAWIEKLVAERDEARGSTNVELLARLLTTEQALEAAQAKVGQIEAAVRDATRSFCDCDGYVVASEVNARLDKALAEGGSNG